jgi:hypothetical protein
LKKVGQKFGRLYFFSVIYGVTKRKKKMRLVSYGPYHHQEERIVNGALRVVDVFNWPMVRYSRIDGSQFEAPMSNEARQNWLINHGWSERQAYMVAFNISEAEMQRIENE